MPRGRKKGKEQADKISQTNLSEKEKDQSDSVNVLYKPNPKDRTWKQTKKKLFINYLPKYGTFSKTAQIIGVDRHTIDLWRKDDEDFDRAIAMCDVLITENLERTAMYRAKNGSDNLLMFLLKARDKRFRDKFVQEINSEAIDYMVSRFISVVEKHAPKVCPNCKTHMDLPNKIASELITMSQGLLKE